MISKPAIIRRVQMQDIGNAFEINRPAIENNLVYIQTAISKPHGNCKLKIYNRYTHTKKKKEYKHNTKVSHRITREENKIGRGEERPTKTNPKQLTKRH